MEISESGIGGGGRNADLQFNIIGPDLDRLSEYSDSIIQKLRQYPGIVDLDTTLANRKPELQARIDRAKASQFGLRVTDIAGALRTLVGGDIVGTYKDADEQYDVWLRANYQGRNTGEALEQIKLRPGIQPGGTSTSRQETTAPPESAMVPFISLQ